MLNLRIISDTHLEFPENIPFTVVDKSIDMKKTVLVLAGDIGSLYKLTESYNSDELHTDPLFTLLSEAANNYKDVIYVTGNHEYFYTNLYTADGVVRDVIHDSGWGNVHMCNGDPIVIDGVTFHAYTLWTNIENNNPIKKLNSNLMIDYRMINNGDSLITADDTYRLHMEHFSKLCDNVSVGDVIITHHAPSYKSMAEKYRGNVLNPFFYSELDEFILHKKPSLWVHGHTHSSLDYKIGDTRIICNPRGYAANSYYPENPYFDSKLIVNV